MIKHLLVHVDATAAGETCLNYAIALARHLDARLTGIHIKASAEVAPLYKASQIGRALDLARQRTSDNVAAAAACFREATSLINLACDWQTVAGDMADEISKAARFADLTVLSQAKWPGPPMRHALSLAELTLIKCAGPVLIFPEGAKPAVPAKALVLWDGSQETARALHHAIPLIQACRIAITVTCCDGSETADLGPLLDHLTRHGIAVFDPDLTASAPSRFAGPIERQPDGDFDLVIMGAFGRAPWQEFLFGGPTLANTRKSGVPLLASH